MKINCHKCGILVAEIITGSIIRKGSVMICLRCLAPKQEDNFEKIKTDSKVADFGQFFQGFLNKNKKY